MSDKVKDVIRDLLPMDAPIPAGSVVWLMASRIAELETEVATLRAILASVPAPDEDA